MDAEFDNQNVSSGHPDAFGTVLGLDLRTRTLRSLLENVSQRLNELTPDSTPDNTLPNRGKTLNANAVNPRILLHRLCEMMETASDEGPKADV